LDGETIKRRGWSYFRPVINEYHGLILGTNPLWLLDGQMPFAIEYYMQERLGYEVQIDIIRDPFFTSDSEVNPNNVYKRGIKIHFRQKFYHPDQKLGMPYFGHEISVSYVNHQLKRVDPDIAQDVRFGNLVETGFGYGLFVGNRWMKDPGNLGITLDSFIGIGISKRSYSREVNIGFAGPKSRSKTL